jgi:hypothetical protein
MYGLRFIFTLTRRCPQTRAVRVSVASRSPNRPRHLERAFGRLGLGQNRGTPKLNLQAWLEPSGLDRGAGPLALSSRLGGARDSTGSDPFRDASTVLAPEGDALVRSAAFAQSAFRADHPLQRFLNLDFLDRS